MNSPIRCDCGKLRGTLKHFAPAKVNRILCYCDDCQAFARYLSEEAPKMDAQGGTDIVQMSPAHVSLTSGLEHLACLRMSDKGIFRWYADCCRSPIGNTGGFGLPFLGLIHACVDASEAGGPDALFGPVRARLNTKFAHGEIGPSGSMFNSVRRLAWILLKGKVGGVQKHSPFFNAQTKQPVVEPKILSTDERAELLAEVS